jgi:hypothetical protein
VAVGYPAARGVVAAASYEARQFGVRSALPSVTALRRCPELVFVKPRFEVYRTVSQQIHAIFEEYTPLIQPLRGSGVAAVGAGDPLTCGRRTSPGFVCRLAGPRIRFVHRTDPQKPQSSGRPELC